MFVTLLTGSGKSLCYAIFAFEDMSSHVGSIALIVSSLKALTKDQVSLLVATLMVKFTVGMACMQVSSLSSRGLSAADVIGETENDKSQLTEILNGKFQIIFISPELLLVSSPDPDSQQLRVDYITATWKVGLGNKNDALVPSVPQCLCPKIVRQSKFRTNSHN